MRKKRDKAPKSEPRLSERYSQFCQRFQKASAQFEFLNGYFCLDTAPSLFDSDESPAIMEGTRNKDLKVIAFCKNQDIKKILLELGDKGANVVAIYGCIKVPELYDYELERIPHALALRPDAVFHPQFNAMIEQAAKGQKEFKRREKALRGTIKLVCDLKPIRMSAVDELRKYHPDFNERLVALQKELEAVVTLYIEHAPIFRNKAGKVSGYIASNWGRPISTMDIPKRTTSKSPFWNERIITIVDELKRIGFSAKQAYKKTMDLFTLAFPEIWKDNDPDLIRQRYTYHTKAKK